MRVQIRTMRSSAHRHVEQLPKKRNTTLTDTPGKNTSSYSFKSVLTQPFSLWNDIDEIIAEFLQEWSPSQRSCIINSVIRFLELKIIMEEYETNHLLSPTQLVAHAWHILILETELYRDVTFTIQDFHARPHKIIHHALLRKSEKKYYEARLERTQRLFMSYYGVKMPLSLKEIDGIPIPNPSQRVRGRASSSRRRSNESIVSARDDTASWDKDGEGTKGTREEDFEDEIPWYMPWLPDFYCFNVMLGEGFCSKQDICLEEDIYAINEDVSLLTPPNI